MIGGLSKRVLAQRARDYITQNNIQLLGITGSWGLALVKRATEALLADYLTLRVGRDGASTATHVLGDVLGVPKEGFLGMLGISRVREMFEEEPQVVITEVPLRVPGDIDWLARELPFTHATVANVHSSYVELFGNKQSVTQEFLGLPASLQEQDTVALNIDNTELASFTDNLTARVFGSGQTPAADVQITRMQPIVGGGMVLAMTVDGRQLEGSFPHIHTTLQAQAYASALATWYAIVGKTGKIEQAFKVLQRVAPPHGYASFHEIQGVRVYNDTGDATPESIMAGLYWLSKIHGRTIVILGDVLHLGAEDKRWHTTFGEEAAQVADIFIGVGQSMRVAQTAALQHESPVDTHHFDSAKNAGKWLHGYLHSGDTVYVAGSKDMKMGDIITRLQHGS